MILARQCLYCHTVFTPSPFHPQQQVCFSGRCRLSRQRDYHRKRYGSDPVYRQVCLDSTKKWQARHPDYERNYRLAHPEYVEHNRAGQRRRDQARRIQNLVKNNLALDLKPLPVEVWLVGPQIGALVKNNLAISQVMIVQSVATAWAQSFRSGKEQLSGVGGGPGVIAAPS